MLDRRQDDPPCPSGKLYYTCTTTPQHFFGCCAGNPCHNNGICPGDPNHLSTSALPATTSAAKTISANNHANTRDPTAWFASPTASSVPKTNDNGGQTPTAAIVGGAVGGFLLLLAVGGVWLLLLRRREKKAGKNGHRPEHLPLKLSHSRNSSVDGVSQYSPAPPAVSAAWKHRSADSAVSAETMVGMSPGLGMPSPYLDSPSFQKRSYSAQLSQETPVYAELSSASVDPVELAAEDPGVPLMPAPQQYPQHHGGWDEERQASWNEQRFGSSLNGGAHDSYVYTEEDNARRWEDARHGDRRRQMSP